MSNDYGRLDGKIAIVTGGTQGLGAAIATLFAERGAAGIVICGRNATKGEAKAAEISKATGTRVVYVQADLEKVEDARKVVSSCDTQFGRVDALVNAAAITDRGTILDTSPELFDRMFAVNVRAPFFLMQEAINVMRREKIEGTIVNIGSMSAMAGQPFGRLVDPAEVARACAYLSSAESGLMTGSMICLDQSIWGAYDGSPHPVAAI